MAYVVDQIGGWQAPVDDDEMRAWATQVHAPYLNGPTLPLPTLIAPPLPICPTLINEQVHDLLASSRDLALEVILSSPAPEPRPKPKPKPKPRPKPKPKPKPRPKPRPKA